MLTTNQTIPSAISISLLWLTDLHLDKAEPSGIRRIKSQLENSEYQAAVVTGDTSSASTLCAHLEFLALACSPRPVYFTLGNHDFYGEAMSHTYRRIRILCRSLPNLVHLQDGGPVSVGRHTALIGHHGWADARCGWGKSTVIQNPDHWSIPDFRKLGTADRFRKMEDLGRQSAKSLRNGVLAAARRHKHLLVATHVPPFPSTTYFDGKPCGPCHQPHYVNLSVGSMLIGVARSNPHLRFTVLAGHTHSAASQSIHSNLHARVGHARTGKPQTQPILSI